MKIDARGKQCPLPVMDAKEGLKKAAPGEIVEVCVDNEIAVQNLTKMAKHKGLGVESQKKEERVFFVRIQAAGGERKEEERDKGEENRPITLEQEEKKEEDCIPDGRKKGSIVVISSEQMGRGDDVLGKLLMKGFLYALAGQEELPETLLMYNGGVKLACEGAESLEDLQQLEAMGVEILSCGTCLNHYGLTDQLRVGSVTNMYEIAERMIGALHIVKP